MKARHNQCEPTHPVDGEDPVNSSPVTSETPLSGPLVLALGGLFMITVALTSWLLQQFEDKPSARPRFADVLTQRQLPVKPVTEQLNVVVQQVTGRLHNGLEQPEMTETDLSEQLQPPVPHESVQRFWPNE